MYTPIYMYIL